MPTPERPSLIVRQKSPENIEFPFASLSDRVIPTELFFVRNQFPPPDLDARDWRLRVGGAVERPIGLDLDSTKAMRSTTFPAVRLIQVCRMLDLIKCARWLGTPQVERLLTA